MVPAGGVPWQGDGPVVYIDPWGVGDGVPADVILITHAHHDHFQPHEIERLRTPTTKLVAPRDVADELTGDVTPIEPGQAVEASGLKIEAVPAYNTAEERLDMHPKANGWVGYLFEFGGRSYYHAGDTDALPELESLDPDVAMVPIGGRTRWTGRRRRVREGDGAADGRPDALRLRRVLALTRWEIQEGGGTGAGPGARADEPVRAALGPRRREDEMALGYDKPLYILAFDHRGSFQKKFFGVSGEPDEEETARISDAKRVIYEGARRALDEGVEADAAGVLVDEQFGAAIARDAKAAGFRLAMPVEKSGQEEFDFQYGDEFGAHIETFDPNFSKVLVRYNTEGDQVMNERQAGRLKRLGDWLHEHGRLFLFELLVPATPGRSKPRVATSSDGTRRNGPSS